MKITISLYFYVKEWIRFVLSFLGTFFVSTTKLRLEIVALRSQLALFMHDIETGKRPKPKPTPAFRQLWVILSKCCTVWKTFLAVFTPDTVIKWHKTAFKIVWTQKSKKIGRPSISPTTIALIKQFHKKNPILSPEKIHEKLVLLGVLDAPAPNTIKKYLDNYRKSPSQKKNQSWKTFFKNHSYHTCGMDFFTMPTLRFEILYVLIIIHHGTREIIHFAVTKFPNTDWLKQQLRNATPYGKGPKYLIHDNDSVFVSQAFQEFLQASGIKSKKTSIQSPWQNPYAERVIGTLRRELLDHVIPLSEEHLQGLLKEYVEKYYNPQRTHQGINCQTPIPSPTYLPTKAANTKLRATPILNGLYHIYEKKS